MTHDWYYAVAGQQYGPVSWDDLRVLAVEKKIAGGDLVWNENMTEWAEARTVPGLLPTKPPPLPTGATKTNSTLNETNTPSRTLGGEVSFTARMEPYTGRSTSSDSDKVDVAIDGRKFGSGSLRNGFNLPGVLRATLGIHCLTISPSAGVGTKFMGLFGKRPESILPEETYRIEFAEPGDYLIKFQFDEPRSELDYPVRADVERRGNVQGLDVLAKQGVALIGKGLSALTRGWKNREESSRRAQLHGLWQPASGSGMWFIMTPDGAMLRADGLATRFRWLDDQTIELYEDGCASTVSLAVLSLSRNELIVKADAQAGHFFRTDTISQTEERRRQEEAERARAEFLAKAGTVAAVLAIGGVAVLCGVAGTAATLDSDSGGDVTPTAGPKSPSTAVPALKAPTVERPPARREAFALRGAVIAGYQGSQVVIRHKCESCGTLQPGQTVMSFSSAVTSGGFSCHRCHSQQEYAIQGMS